MYSGFCSHISLEISKLFLTVKLFFVIGSKKGTQNYKYKISKYHPKVFEAPSKQFLFEVLAGISCLSDKTT